MECNIEATRTRVEDVDVLSSHTQRHVRGVVVDGTIRSCFRERRHTRQLCDIGKAPRALNDYTEFGELQATLGVHIGGKA